MDSNKYYFKIPFDNSVVMTDDKLHIVGIIDASGSMSNLWKWLAEFWNKSIPKKNCHTITFDHRVFICNDNVLTKKITTHGGGKTSIPEALQKFEEHIALIPKDHTITAIFISDGQDTDIKTLEQRMLKLQGHQKKNINFICLGIQKDFPTFLSMRLRDLYHTGDETIPALYLIEFASEKAFFNKFEVIKRFFYAAKKVSIDPPVQIYLWEEDVYEDVFEGQWIISKTPEITVEGKVHKLYQIDLSIEDVTDLFRGWVQNLQLASLNDAKQAQIYSQQAIFEMNKLVDQASQKIGINIRKVDENSIDEHNVNFNEKAKKHYIYRYGNKINWFLNEIEVLAKGLSPKLLDEYEAAKRINIGTIIGKYHQKALALKGINIDDFQKIRDEFAQIFKTTKITLNESDQEKSVVTLLNQKEIFLQQGFIEGLQYCKNQYDLVETFPLIGHAIKVKRYDGSLVNPWLTKVQFIAKQNKAIDSSYLVKKLFNVELFTGGEQKESINGILPLYSLSDQDLSPILTSRMYKLLMTFMVMQNIDTFYEDAYLALLGNTVLFLIDQEKSQWRQEMLQLCYSTLKLVYGNEKSFNNYINLLINNPNNAFQIQEDVENKVDLTKPLVFLFYLSNDKTVQKNDLLKIFDSIFIYFFKRIMQGNSIFNIMKPQIDEKEKQEIQNFFIQNLDSYFALCDFRKDFTNKFLEYIRESDHSVKLSKKLLFDETYKVKLKSLIDLYEETFEVKFEYKQLFYYAYHIHLHGVDAFNKEIIKDYKVIKEFIVQKIDEKSIKTGKIYADLHKEIENLFTQRFIDRHWNIQTLTQDQLKAQCQYHKIDINTLQYDPATQLCKNACMSSQCPFFLKAAAKFSIHLGSWQGKIPNGFHRFVKANCKLTIDELYAKSIKKWKGFPEKYNVTKDFALKHIKKVVDQYNA